MLCRKYSFTMINLMLLLLFVLPRLAASIEPPDVTHLITFDRSTSTFETYTPSIDPPPGVSVEGGMGCLAVMSEPKTVVFEGEAWKNEVTIHLCHSSEGWNPVVADMYTDKMTGLQPSLE